MYETTQGRSILERTSTGRDSKTQPDPWKKGQALESMLVQGLRRSGTIVARRRC
jgi:hypothetical protein